MTENPSDNSLNGLSIIQLQTTPGPQTVDFISHIILNSGHDLKERKKVSLGYSFLKQEFLQGFYRKGLHHR
jgi:hypothetical protein